jgi:hypothetical protein
MQTVSNLRITFNPGGYVLLNFRSVDGSLLSDEVETGLEQQTSIFAAIGALYSGASADGGMRQPLSFTRTLEHADRATAMNYQWTYPRLLPFGVVGTLTVEIENAATFLISDAVILAAVPRLNAQLSHATDTAYRLSGGNMIPTAGLPVAAGYPLSWYLTNCTDIATACADL